MKSSSKQSTQPLARDPEASSAVATTHQPLPRKWTPERRDLLLKGAALGASKRTLARSVGINRETLDEWLSSDHPELQAFAEEFEASIGGAHVEMHASIKDAGMADWKASAWLLERTNEDYQAKNHAALGFRPGDMAQPLNEKQIEHRVVQSIAFPTENMQRLLREANKRGNPTWHALVDEFVRTRPVLTEGSETEEAAPELDTAGLLVSREWIAEQQARVLKALDDYARIVIYGGPKTGKTQLFAACIGDRKVVHTDDYIAGHDWTDVPEQLTKDIAALGEKWCLEGVRALSAVKAGADAQVIINCRTAIAKRTKGQETMAKGRETNLRNFLRDRPGFAVIDLGD